MEPNNNLEDFNKSAQHDANKDKASSTSIYAVVAIIVLLFVGYLLTKGNKKDEGLTLNNGVVTTEQEMVKKGDDLSAEERTLLEARATEAQNEINELPETATPDDRYKAHIKLAAANYRLGKFGEAIVALDKIKEESSTKARIWTQYTLVYKDQGNLDKARESVAKALELDPTNPQHLLLNIELAVDQNKENLDKLYSEALTKSENYIDVVIAYAQFLEKQGDKTKAIEFWNKAKSINAPGSAQYDAEIARLQK